MFNSEKKNLFHSINKTQNTSNRVEIPCDELLRDRSNQINSIWNLKWLNDPFCDQTITQISSNRCARRESQHDYFLDLTKQQIPISISNVTFFHAVFIFRLFHASNWTRDWLYFRMEYKAEPLIKCQFFRVKGVDCLWMLENWFKQSCLRPKTIDTKVKIWRKRTHWIFGTCENLINKHNRAHSIDYIVVSRQLCLWPVFFGTFFSSFKAEKKTSSSSSNNTRKCSRAIFILTFQ